MFEVYSFWDIKIRVQTNLNQLPLKRKIINKRVIQVTDFQWNRTEIITLTIKDNQKRIKKVDESKKRKAFYKIHANFFFK